MMRAKPLLIIVLLFAFLLAGCTSGDVADTVHSTPAPDKSSSGENYTENINKISSDKDGTIVNINDVMEFPDLGELIIAKAEFTDEVHPTNPDGFHTYYKSKASDKEFFHLVGTFKNKSENDVDFNIFEYPIKFRLVYKEKYKYDGFVVVEEDGGGDFAISEFVEPLTSATIHALIEVPKKVQESGEVITVIIKAGKTTYNMKFKE